MSVDSGRSADIHFHRRPRQNRDCGLGCEQRAVGGTVVGAAGGLVGALTNAGGSKEEADVYAEGVRRGGTLVSAKVDDDKIASAESALNAIPYVDIASRGAAYHQSGWSSFDPKAAPYTDDEIVAERARYR